MNTSGSDVIVIFSIFTKSESCTAVRQTSFPYEKPAAQALGFRLSLPSASRLDHAPRPRESETIWSVCSFILGRSLETEQVSKELSTPLV